MAINKLSDYGYSFQIKVLSCLLSDKNYLSKVYDILSPNYFDSDANQFIVKTIIKHFAEYKTQPTPELIKVYIENIPDELLKLSVKKQIVDVYTNIDSSDLPAIKDNVLDFCKVQTIKEALANSIDLLELGKLDEVKNVIDNAFKKGIEKDIGHDYKDDVEERYNEDPREPIPTPWKIINDITDGGYGNGELWIWVGRPGSGKCVGPNTEIKIQYDEIGITDDNGNIIWFNPWDKINLNGKIVFAYELDLE